jgi:hypothetical protein
MPGLPEESWGCVRGSGHIMHMKTDLRSLYLFERVSIQAFTTLSLCRV